MGFERNLEFMMLRFCILAAVLAFTAAAQSEPYAEDLRSARSPNGEIEVQVFVGQPVVAETSVLPRMAYRILYKGRPVMETSFLGFELRAQNAMGEKPGLTTSESGAGDGFNWIICHFLQNGSQGRMYDIEARAYNSGVAFRYFIPWSAPMENILIEGENTEFQFPADARAADASKTMTDLPIEQEFPLPFTVEVPRIGWVSLSQAGAEAYAPVTVRHDTSSVQGPTMVTQLARLKDKPWLAFETKPPYTSPWRVIAIAPTRQQLSAPRP